MRLSCWKVHPRVGVWIEIICGQEYPINSDVHPRVGVWIEICVRIEPCAKVVFTPVWGCGLKLKELRWRRSRRMAFTPVWGCGLKC